MTNDFAKSNLTAQICKKINTINFENISDTEILERGRQIFADAIAVTVAGAQKEVPPSILAQNAQRYGGHRQASVVGFNFKTSVPQAALINGASMHVLDYGPMWNPPNHQLSTCLPAILALAEHKRSTGKEIFTALIKGVEMMSFLRAASGQNDLNKVPFHPPGMVGPMGATVACASILKLNDIQLQYALGIAASKCGSLMANSGTHTKCLHCGQSSYIGVDSALLAQQGFTSNPGILEASKGYIGTFFDSATFDSELMLDYGSKFRILDPGYEIKPFPSNFGTHAAINAGLDLHSLVNGRYDKITKVQLTGPDFPYLSRPHPISGLDGKFSAQYTFVCGLLDGKVVINSFTDERRFSADVESLLNKIEYVADPQQSAAIGKGHIDALLHMENGERFHASGYSPRNNRFGSEILPFEQHRVKLLDCMHVAMDNINAHRIIEMCMTIDRLSAPEFLEFMALLI